MRMSAFRLRIPHLGLRAKIYLLAAILTVFTMLVGIVGAVAVVYLQKTMQDAVGDARERAEVATNVRLSVVDIDRAQSRLIATQNPDDIKREAVAAIKAATYLDDALTTLQDKLKNNAAVAELVALNQSVALTRMIIIKSVKGQNLPKAYESAEKIRGKIQRIEELSNQIYTEEQATLTARVSDKKISERTIMLLASFVGITLLIAAITSYFFGHQLTNLIREIQRKIGGDASEDESDLALATHANNVREIASGIASCEAQMNDAVNQIKSGVEEVRHSSEQTGEQVKQASGYIKSVSESVSDSASNVSKVANEFSIMKNDLMATMETTRSLQRSVNNIGDIVATIHEISAQTKLLSLNASIEAARAGNLGRGFAVVAGEVRTLAQRTDVATEQIQEIAKNVYAEVNLVVSSLQHSANNATQYTSRLNTAIEDSASIAKKVTGAREMMNVVDEFIQVQHRTVDMIRDQLAEVESSIGLSITHSASLQGVSDGLSVSAETLADMADKIRL